MRGRKRFLTAGFLWLMVLALGGCDLATSQPVLKPDATLGAPVESVPTEVFDVSMLTAAAQLAVEIEVTAGTVTPLGATIVLGPPKANSAQADLTVRALAGDKVLAEYLMPDPLLAEADEKGTVVLSTARTFVYVPLSADLTVLQIAPVTGRVGEFKGGSIELQPLIRQACDKRPEVEECQKILRNPLPVRVVLGGKPFDSPEVQQAVLMAMDWKGAINDLYPREDVAVVVSVWPSGTVSQDARAEPFNPDVAKERLTKAGYGNGFSLLLVYPSTDKQLQALAELMYSSLIRLAIGAETVAVGPADAQVYVEERIKAGYTVISLDR